MQCPFCQSLNLQVKDSRATEDGSAIRRRRACADCGGRFTTFERIQLREMMVRKHSGRVQLFDRDKLIKSMQLALRKRPVEMDAVEKLANSIQRQLESNGEPEISSREIGELAMHGLARLDKVGFIRYASVYKDFRDPQDFNAFLEDLKELQQQDST